MYDSQNIEENDKRNIDISNSDEIPEFNNDNTSELTNVKEIPLKAASALTENLPDLNPTTQVDNSGINTEPYDFAGMVNKAIEMHASTFDTDTYTELCKRNL